MATGKAVQVRPVLTAPTRHPIKAARLLYSLPPFLLRGPIYLIFMILFGGIVYAVWAKQDVLVMAPLVLEKDSFTVQVTGQGLVAEVNVRDNSFVRSGDQLAVIQEQLRPFDDAQREALEGQQLELEKERDKVANEFEHKIAQLRFDLQDLKSNRVARTQELEGQIKILSQQLTTAHNAKKVSESALGIAQRQYNTMRKLFASRDVTVSQRDQALEKLTASQKAVFDAGARIAEITIALQTAQAELSKYKDLLQQAKIEKEIAQSIIQRDRNLKRLDERIQSIATRLSTARYQEGATYLENKALYTSLFDGVITQVHVARGQMIPAGTPLITMVRDTAVLEAHAFVDNKDIGQLKRGQEVKIKYFAYPYQEYGIASGLISSIATTSSGQPGAESKYLVKIALRADAIQRRGARAKPLEIGLEGIAEFKTGERRLIEIFFSPISKFFAPEGESV